MNRFLDRFIRALRIIICILVISLLLPNLLMSAEATGSTIRIINSTSEAIELNVTVGELNIIESPESDQVTLLIEGETHGAELGMPELPHITRLIAVPFDANVTVEWTSDVDQILQANSPMIVSRTSESGQYQFPQSTRIRESNWVFPESEVEIGTPVIMRGIRMVNLTINPVQYDSRTNEFTIRKNFNITLKFDREDAENVVVNPLRPRPSKTARKLAARMVINPEDISEITAESNGTYVYVIPDYEGVAEAIAPLVNWRLRQGYPTQIITIEEDASNVDVRRLIQDAYYEWDIPPEMITLVGEADLVNADFMVPTWDVGRQFMWETDYKYVLLEGDDLLPDAAIARISTVSVAQLQDIVAKIMNYETAPDMEDPSWMRRGAVMANDPRTGYSSVYLQRWARAMMLETGFTEVDTFLFIHNDVQGSGHDFIERNLNEGISLFNYRGWGQFNGDWRINDAFELNNVNRIPFLILPTCNSCDFADHIISPYSYAEAFLWADGGGIGVVGSSGFTHTNYNNVFDGGVMNALLRDDNWRLGWAVNQGKLELYRHFGLFNDVEDPQVRNLLTWEAHAYQLNIISDCGTELWTDIPQQADVTHQESLNIGENRLTFSVVDSETGDPISGANITLVRDLRILRQSETGVDGNILFTFEPGELVEGEYMLSASMHDMIPYLGEISVIDPDKHIGLSSIIIDDDGAGMSNGNGDREANPGETIELRTYIRNFGESEVEGRTNVILQSNFGDVEIAENRVELESAPAIGDSALVTFIVEIGYHNDDLDRLAFLLTVSNGDDSWESSIAFNAATPNLEYVTHTFEPNPFNAGDTAWVEVTVNNIGSLDSEELNAVLVSNREVITVFNQNSIFAPVEADGEENATARFWIYAHTLTVPGTPVNMTIEISNEAGFSDRTEFDFVVGAPQDNTPFGPDDYGYVCFDDTDEAWEENCPVYEWVEIDPALDGPGTDTEINDLGNEEDWSVLIDLPFDFQYYGNNEFDKLTICSNGWFAFGDQSRLSDFQNRRIPPALGPSAQVCVFWDDLVNYVDEEANRIGGVYYWYDEENNRFIIEWSQMRRYIGLDEEGVREGGLNTFQAIIYDPQFHQTYTQDGEIVFQYQTVNNDPEVDPLEFDTPYATVGIVNLNGTAGMEYTYWDEYAAGAAVLENERAIKFSTVLLVVVGYAEGNITDIETGEPIQNAEIRGSLGAFGLTDANGNFFMNNILIGDDYDFTAWAPGYNDSTRFGFDIIEGDTISLSFALRHPEFIISRDSIMVGLQPEFESTQKIMLENDGNGPLVFSSRFDYWDDDGGEQWSRLADFNASDLTGDGRIQGVDYLGDDFWATGSNNRNNPNKFYLFNRETEYISSVDQPGESAYGFRGTTTVGDIIYGGDGAWIIGVDADGTIVDSIPGPFDLQRAIAHDYQGNFYVANSRDEPIVLIDHEGNRLGEWQTELDIWGLGYLRDDPDGYPLYIASRDKTNPNLQVPFALVTKFDPVGGDSRVVTALEGELEDRVAGMEIVNEYDFNKWVMVAIMTNPNGDRVSVYDMGPNTDWVSFEPRSGVLPPGESREIAFVISAAGFDEGEFGLILNYIHNAEGLSTQIPIRMIVDEAAGTKDDISLPIEFGLSQNFPNPFNNRTDISYNLDKAGWVSLTLYDIAGRELMSLAEDYHEVGSYTIGLDAGQLVSGLYFARLQSGGRTAFIKLALLK